MTDDDDRRRRPGKRPPAPDAAVDKPASAIETAPTAGDKQPGAQSVEVAAEAYEPSVPTSDPPSGDMRPLDMESQPADGTREQAIDLAQSPGYVPAPIPYDAPTQPTGPSSAEPGPSTPPRDEPILPAAYDEAALRDAIGPAPPRAKKKKRERLDDDGLPVPAGRRTLQVGLLALLVGLAIAGFVLLGRVNAQRYVIACSASQITAERGRGFPPWGEKPLAGPEWRPIALPANAECKPRETDDPAELERWYLELLVDRASTTLTARNLLDGVQQGKPNPLDLAADQLNQALLLSRAPERRDQRKEVERLLGDIQYWRASLRLRDAAAALSDAARQFDAAATQRPRHVTDAGEWATLLRRLVDDLHAGPGGVSAATAPVQPGAEPPAPAPLGTALPVEAEGSGSEPAPAPPDAGLPTGGVLL